MTYRTFALSILSVIVVAPAPAAEPTYRGRTAQEWVAARLRQLAGPTETAARWAVGIGFGNRRIASLAKKCRPG